MDKERRYIIDVEIMQGVLAQIELAGKQLEAMARANGWQWSAPSTLTGAETDDWRTATEAVFVPFDRSEES